MAGGVGAGAGGDHARRYLQSVQTDLSDLTRLFDNWPLSSRGDFVSDSLLAHLYPSHGWPAFCGGAAELARQ